MPVNILNMNVNVVADLIGMRRPEPGPRGAKHNGALVHRKLRMSDVAVRCRSPQALRKAESATQPLERFADVFINKHRHDCRSWCGSVDQLVTSLADCPHVPGWFKYATTESASFKSAFPVASL